MIGERRKFERSVDNLVKVINRCHKIPPKGETFDNLPEVLADCIIYQDRSQFKRIVDSLVDYAARIQRTHKLSVDAPNLFKDTIWHACERMDGLGLSGTKMFGVYKPKNYSN